MFCDKYPEWQEYRRVALIAFTGHDPGEWEAPCPAEQARERNRIYAWSGNVPRPANPCALGHEFDVITGAAGTPVLVHCEQCNDSWSVKQHT